MSFGRPLPSHLRQSSVHQSNPGASSQGQSPILAARVAEKRQELENLKELRDLSAGLAGQMSVLEEKLATLSDGTEAVALVLSNWHNVLRAISMAASKIPQPRQTEEEQQEEVPLPQTLVRIPTEQAPIIQQHQDAAEEARNEESTMNSTMTN